MAIDFSARVIFAVCALSLMAGMLQLIRLGLLKEKYTLLWLPIGAGLFVFGLFPEILVWVSARLHLHYITVVVLCLILAFSMILLYFTVRLSGLREDVKKLAQELTLLRSERGAQAPGPTSDGWVARPAEERKTPR